MESTLNTKEIKQLYKAFLQLTTSEEVKNFLRDLCTVSEINAMAERLTVAKQINQEIPYRKISQTTGASTATVTRVAHWLHHGMGGYKLVLKRMS